MELTHSTSSEAAEHLGSIQPRLATPPLRELAPETSYGYDVIWFAEHVLGAPLDKWEEAAVIRGGELLPDGRPRFRTLLILVARQNGKTTLAKVLILYWLFIERIPLVGLTSTDRGYAKRAWSELCETVADNRWLAADTGKGWRRLSIGEESLLTKYGAEFKFAANNRRAFRSATLHRWICDELREHDTMACWTSASNAMNAVADAQTIAITNQGDETATVLDSLRLPALEYIETGQGDPRLGLLEWSAPSGCEPDDIAAICAANPNAGRRLDLEALLAAGRKAKRAGGSELADFRTEVLCQRVSLLDPAIDPDLWGALGTAEPIDLSEHRDRVAVGIDVSLDGSHSTAVAAAEIGGTVHVEVVGAWDHRVSKGELRTTLRRVAPKVVGWLPNGPAAAIAPAIQARRGEQWPPSGMSIEALSGDAPAVCMGLDEIVRAGAVRQPRDELVDAHLRNSQRISRGDAWVFARRGSGPIDASYALAAAVYLARTMPAPRGGLVIA